MRSAFRALSRGKSVARCSPERAAKRVGARALAADARSAQIALERCLLDLAMELAVVLLLDPGLRGDVEEIERERFLALEHGQESSFDLGPEVFLFAVLLG